MPTTYEVTCPKCGAGNMWDNRDSKRNPKAPDYRCRDRDCDGAVWEKKAGKSSNGKQGFSSGDLPGDPAPVTVRTPEQKKLEWESLKTMHLRALRAAMEEAKELETAKIGDSPEACSARTAQLFIAAKEMGLHR